MSMSCHNSASSPMVTIRTDQHGNYYGMVGEVEVKAWWDPAIKRYCWRPVSDLHFAYGYMEIRGAAESPEECINQARMMRQFLPMLSAMREATEARTLKVRLG